MVETSGSFAIEVKLMEIEGLAGTQVKQEDFLPTLELLLLP